MSLACRTQTRAGDVILDARKALYIPDHDALLLGDIHFEKASYLQVAGGHPLPAYDTRDNLDRLNALIRAYRPARIIALGDSFHDVEASARLSAADRDRINAITAESEMIWVLGNHDPDIPVSVAGAREDHVQLGKFLLTHHPHVEPSGVNICGHLHPKARVKLRGRRASGPCFAVCPARIIVPSFGAYTGGLYVTDPAFRAETRLTHDPSEVPCRYYLINKQAIIPIDPATVI